MRMIYKGRRWCIRLGACNLPTRFFLAGPPDAFQEAVEEIKEQRLASSGPETMQRDILTELATPHIASPDVHVDTVDETIVMYIHLSLIHI